MPMDGRILTFLTLAGLGAVRVAAGSRSKSEESRARSEEPAGRTPRSSLSAPRSPGSRGVVRKGRAPTPHDPLAERFFEKAGYSHPPEASEAQILQIRRRHGRDLAKAWRALQDDASIDARWNVEENPDTSWMDPETLEAYQSGNMEILSLTFNRLDSDGYPTETLDHLGEISLSTTSARENRWDRELFEAEMALGLGLGQEPE